MAWTVKTERLLHRALICLVFKANREQLYNAKIVDSYRMLYL